MNVYRHTHPKRHMTGRCASRRCISHGINHQIAVYHCILHGGGGEGRGGEGKGEEKRTEEGRGEDVSVEEERREEEESRAVVPAGCL